MGSTFRDRTAEFRSLSQTLKKIGAIPSVHQAESDPTTSSKRSPPGSSRSEFNKKASQIGLRIHETSQKTARLSKLAKESSIFNDRTLEIQELTVLIRNDITGLNMALSDLQTLQNMEIADGSYSHDKVGHYTAVCDDLKTRLMGATKQFQDVLTARSEVRFIYFLDFLFICDEDIKSASTMEKGIRRKPVENMKLRRAREADQDICAIKTSYLTNQEEFIHETGYDGFYTQQELTANWFHTKRINGLGDMPFSSQKFLDLPYLKAHWFNQLQTRHWRPGETSNQLGDQPKHPGESETFLQCTSIHQIVQNQPRPYLPFLESKAINTQQLFSHQDWHDFYQYFCSKEVPKKLTYSLKPSRYKAIISAL